MSQVSQKKRKAKRDALRANGQLEQKPVQPPEPVLDENGNPVPPPHKPYPQLDAWRASVFLRKQEEKKHTKKHARQEKREAKEANKHKKHDHNHSQEAAKDETHVQ